MGFPKALLPLGGGTFLTRVLDTLEESGLCNSIVVLGKHARFIEPGLARRSVSILVNPDPSRGQISSIQLAIQTVASSYSACLVWPVDQPMISAHLLVDLISLFQASGASIAYPTWKGKRGHPAIFHRALFWELLHCPAETGARSVVARHQGETIVLPTSEAATVTDIDTPEDYFNLTGEMLDKSWSLGN